MANALAGAAARQCQLPMARARYHLLDVFTDRPFAGNPLAVFVDPTRPSSAPRRCRRSPELGEELVRMLVRVRRHLPKRR